MTHQEFYSPAEVSQALGVSVTTVKRWVDAGVLSAHKTAGGHRKILRADVLRVVHEGNFPRLDLSRLNGATSLDKGNAEKPWQSLFGALQAGDIVRTRSVIHGAYAAGMAIEELGDAVIAPAMAQVGFEWEHGRIDVMHEHRSTLLCTAVLHELKPALESTAEKDLPLAAGGNLEGDHSQLASLLVQMVLLDAGWEAVNLGPHTPLTSFRLALRELEPRMMWLSANYLPDSPTFFEEFHGFFKEAEEAGVAVAIGGRAVHGSARKRMPHTFYGDTLTQLAVFARTLHPRPCLPKRGRPPR